MGCFIGCLGGDKDRKQRKQRIHRSSPRRQRNKFQNVVQQESKAVAAQTINDTVTAHLIPELRTEPEVVKQQPSPIQSPNPSPKKRVTFNSNITTYEHVSVHGSIDSLPDCTTDVEKENQENSKTTSQKTCSIYGEDNSVASYPSNHRYHNAARDSDDETEEYGDSDLDDFDEEEDDDDDDDYDYDYEYEDDYIGDAKITGRDVWSELVFTPSVESRTENPSRQDLSENVESPMMLGSKRNARDRSDYINLVLNPVENTTQWQSVKSKGTKNVLNPQKENLSAAANFELSCVSLSSKPTFKKMSDQSKTKNQEIAVDASLSNWLGSSEIMSSVRTSEDRPISGAMTVEELRKYSASNSPRKSPIHPDETPIIGSIGTYWNHSSSMNNTDSASSYKCTPITTSKYRSIY